jgi:predicted transcriptional regulator
MPDEPSSASVDRELTTKIVAAFVRRNQVSPDQLVSVIATVCQALGRLGQPPAEPNGERTPAVSVRRSVHRDYVVCLECGSRGQTLRRHLMTRHGLSVDAYRGRWNLPRDHAIVAPGYSERRSTMAKQIGLGRGRSASAESTGGPEAETAKASQPNAKGRGRPRSKVTSTAQA